MIWLKSAVVFVVANQGKGVVFMETAMAFHQHRHAFIECVPLDKDVYDDCALFFHKVGS